MKRIVCVAALAAALSLGPASVHAQHIVHDPTAYAQMVREARTALDQLEQLREQIRQGERLFESFNAGSGVNALARELGLPEVRSALPDARSLRAAAEGDLAALGALADRADALREASRIYTPPTEPPSGVDRFYHDALERAGARTARDLAIGEAIDQTAGRRQAGLETLRQALDTAPNARAVLDLEARLSAEQALIQNEHLRLEGLALTQAAEARLEAQRARERAAAARDARLAVYREAIR